MTRGVTEPDSVANEIRELRILSRRITAALVTIAVVAMVFTAASVTRFAIGHDVSVWIAWMLDPMVAGALLTVLLVDARLVELGTGPSGWATALRWFAGLGTWVMNVWSSVWPDGGFGVPTEVDAAGVVLHSIPPVLLIVLAEAATGYRRVIADRIRHLEGRAAADRGTHNVGTPEGLHSMKTPEPAFLRPASTSPGPRRAEGTHGPSTPAGYTSAGTPGDHVRGAAQMVAERVGTGADPWSGGGRPDQADTTAGTATLPTGPVVSPVAANAVTRPVAEPAGSTGSNDHRHDRADDHTTTEPDLHDDGSDVAAVERSGKGVADTDTPALSPVELKRRARRMHRDAVTSTGRPVTVDALRTELGLSRRTAIELRREVVALNGVARH